MPGLRLRQEDGECEASLGYIYFFLSCGGIENSQPSVPELSSSKSMLSCVLVPQLARRGAEVLSTSACKVTLGGAESLPI